MIYYICTQEYFLYLKDSLVLTGHVTYEELSSSAISKLQSPSIYGGGESYIVIPYLLGTPIRIVTSHKDPTVYVFYCNGQENIPVTTVDYKMSQMSKPVQEDHLLGEKCQS